MCFIWTDLTPGVDYTERRKAKGKQEVEVLFEADPNEERLRETFLRFYAG